MYKCNITETLTRLHFRNQAGTRVSERITNDKPFGKAGSMELLLPCHLGLLISEIDEVIQATLALLPTGELAPCGHATGMTNIANRMEMADRWEVTSSVLKSYIS